MATSNFLLKSAIMYNLSMVSILRWNLTMLLSTLFLFSCSKSDNNEETNRKEGDKTNISVYLQQNGFLILNLVPNQNFVSCNVLVCKSVLSGEEISVQLKPWSDSELKAYKWIN